MDALTLTHQGLLLEEVAKLLRNDSILDAGGRTTVYLTVLNLLEAIADYPHLCLFLLQPIDKEEREGPSEEAVAAAAAAASSSSCSSSSSLSVSLSGAATRASNPATLSSLLIILGKQASTFVSLNSSNGEDDDSDEDQPKVANTGGKSAKRKVSKKTSGSAKNGSHKSEAVAEVGLLKDALVLCRRLKAAAELVQRKGDAARRSGVLTPALIRARKRRRKLNPHLFKVQEEDVMILDDSTAEANAA